MQVSTGTVKVKVSSSFVVGCRGPRRPQRSRMAMTVVYRRTTSDCVLVTHWVAVFEDCSTPCLFMATSARKRRTVPAVAVAVGEGRRGEARRRLLFQGDRLGVVSSSGRRVEGGNTTVVWPDGRGRPWSCQRESASRHDLRVFIDDGGSVVAPSSSKITKDAPSAAHGLLMTCAPRGRFGVVGPTAAKFAGP